MTHDVKFVNYFIAHISFVNKPMKWTADVTLEAITVHQQSTTQYVMPHPYIPYKHIISYHFISYHIIS